VQFTLCAVCRRLVDASDPDLMIVAADEVPPVYVGRRNRAGIRPTLTFPDVHRRCLASRRMRLTVIR